MRTHPCSWNRMQFDLVADVNFLETVCCCCCCHVYCCGGQESSIQVRQFVFCTNLCGNCGRNLSISLVKGTAPSRCQPRESTSKWVKISSHTFWIEREFNGERSMCSYRSCFCINSGATCTQLDNFVLHLGKEFWTA